MTTLATGGFHTCAIAAAASGSSGGLRCWGLSVRGQIGYNTISPSTRPGQQDVFLGSASRNVRSVSAGTSFTCVSFDDGNMRCWGDGRHGALGIDNDGNDWGVTPNPDPNGEHFTMQDLEDCRIHTFVDDRDYHNNNVYQCDAVSVATGDGHTCAILDCETKASAIDSGLLKCWGRNHNGQLGQGHTTNLGIKNGNASPNPKMRHVEPINLGDDRTVVAVCAGAQHTCAVLDNGHVKCFGGNSNGELGIGDNTKVGAASVDIARLKDTAYKVDLGTDKTAYAVACGSHHTCAILSSGGLKCWGANDRGQLGISPNGDQFDRDPIGDSWEEMGDALPEVDLGGSHVATAVSGGLAHTCALLENRRVKCWGSNEYGQLGIDSTGDETAPQEAHVQFSGPLDVVGIHAGHGHTCAVSSEGGVRCWGKGSDGQLGYGSTDDKGGSEGDMAKLSDITFPGDVSVLTPIDGPSDRHDVVTTVLTSLAAAVVLLAATAALVRYLWTRLSPQRRDALRTRFRATVAPVEARVSQRKAHLGRSVPHHPRVTS